MSDVGAPPERTGGFRYPRIHRRRGRFLEGVGFPVTRDGRDHDDDNRKHRENDVHRIATCQSGTDNRDARRNAMASGARKRTACAVQGVPADARLVTSASMARP
ncbi:MAG: hypothetical protein KatS3mg082_1442 [Nitrospiraceae bacterium]|nr:MAG: hypothetical protein KatS3mg082_1442 [Nitrospiraceae bacterium]